jgi:hypothetical protein
MFLFHLVFLAFYWHYFGQIMVMFENDDAKFSSSLKPNSELYTLMGAFSDV